MGQLKEGVQLIYERDNGTVYAREFGAEPTTRKVVGIDYPVTENVNWHDVMVVAKTNRALQNALDHAIMLYKLSKESNE